MTGAREAMTRRLRHLAAAATIGAASMMSAPAFARGPDGIADNPLNFAQQGAAAGR
jgi:hypothetical protein